MENITDCKDEPKVVVNVVPIPQHTLADVTPKLEKKWFMYPWLLQLNVLLLGAILAQVTSGYDGSMMNNLQTLPRVGENTSKILQEVA